MPTDSGAFKGISVPAEAWERIFGAKRPDHWPQRDEAQERGCTCAWWGTGAIVEFSAVCPILDEHRPARHCLK